MKKFNVEVQFGDEVVKAGRYVVYEIPHIVQILIILAVFFTPFYVAVPVILVAVADFFYGNRKLFKKVKSDDVEDQVHPLDNDTKK